MLLVCRLKDIVSGDGRHFGGESGCPRCSCARWDAGAGGDWDCGRGF